MNERDQPSLTVGEFESLTTDDQFRKDVAKKFQALDFRMISQDVAIEEVKEAMKADVAAVKLDVAHLRNDISENTVVTRKIATDTAAILSAWNDGVAAKRFFCRLADAWRFILKQVLLPFGVPIMALYGFWYYTTYKEFPSWISAVFKVFMAIV
jgi:hypothetical protein